MQHSDVDRRKGLVLRTIREAALEEQPAPSIEQFMASTQLSRMHVYDAIKRLAKDGRIEVVKHHTHRQYLIPLEGLETYSPRESLMDIVYKAGAIFDIPAHQIIGPDRYNRLILPRFAFFYVAAVKGFSTPIIGNVSGRDHSTVVYGRDQAVIKMVYDPAYHRDVEDLQRAYDGRVEWHGFKYKDLEPRLKREA